MTGLGSGTIFFLLSNFGCWLMWIDTDGAPVYSQTMAGLTECYTLAWPFFRGRCMETLRSAWCSLGSSHGCNPQSHLTLQTEYRCRRSRRSGHRVKPNMRVSPFGVVWSLCVCFVVRHGSCAFAQDNCAKENIAQDNAPAAPVESAVTVAGTGQDGFSATPGLATELPLSQPFGLCIGPDQALYVCSVGSHVIYRIDPATQAMTVVAGCGRKGYSGDGGPAVAAELNEPYEIRFDANGLLYFVEMQNHLVRSVDLKTGVIRTVAGTGRQGFGGDDGPATEALMNRPHSIAFDGSGNLYICDIGNHRIRRVQMSTGVITTFAGTGERQPTPDGSPITGTPLNGPRALDF